MRAEVTALVITFNEAPNIRRCLERLVWLPKVLVLDSGSDDETRRLACSFSNVRFVVRPFDSFADQCNFGLSLIETPWVLSLDADYILSDDLMQEIQTLVPSLDIAGYKARFVFRIHGHPLRGSLYPPRTVLYRRACARYVNEGHGHRVLVSGRVATLRGAIFHDDRKPLSRWFGSQQRYARDEARHLLAADPAGLNLVDRLRRRGWPLVLLVPLYVLLVKRCVLDGLPGWHYALQRLIAECMIALEITERRLASGNRSEAAEQSSNEHVD